MCFGAMGCEPEEPDRREMLKRMAALGLSLPFATAALSASARANSMSFLDRGEFLNALTSLVERAHSPELAAFRVFGLGSQDMPWKDLDLELEKGQQVTFLIGGRVWVSREHDIWFEPGVCFAARSRGLRPMFHPMSNTGTMTAAHDGPIEIARALAEWADEDGALWTPEEAYKSLDVDIYGVALAWKGDAIRGLESLAAHGDGNDPIAVEIARLKSPRRLPQGWSHFYMGGGDADIFFDVGGGVIGCQPLKNGAILQKPVDIALEPGVKLDWRWIVEELPSAHPEDQIVTHDYVSLGLEYDDGQDLTYIWSAGLPDGHVFRCPYPRWNPIETHMVVRTGYDRLGQWLDEARDVYADYTTHVGGPARRIVRVWLLGVSLFQRRPGACRFADIRITKPDGAVMEL